MSKGGLAVVAEEDRRAITKESLVALMEDSERKLLSLSAKTETLRESRRLSTIINACSILLMEEYDRD